MMQERPAYLEPTPPLSNTWAPDDPPPPVDPDKPGVRSRGRAWVLRTTQDRVLVAGFVLLSIASLMPFFVTPILPFVDLGMNTAMAASFWDALFRDGTTGNHFRVSWRLLPYWTTYLMTALTAPVFGVLAAAKIQAAVSMLILPAGLIRLLGALGRDRRFGLLGFFLLYNYNLYFGFTAFLLGIGLALFSLASLIEADRPRRAISASVWGFLAGVTHLHSAQILVLGAIPVLLLKRGWRQRIVVGAAGLCGAGIALSPFVFPLVLGIFRDKQPTTTEHHSLPMRAVYMFDHSFGDTAGPTFNNAGVYAFMAMMLVPVIGFLVPQRRQDWRKDVIALSLALLPLLFYFILPFKVFVPGTALWYYYPRFLVVGFLLLLALPRPDLGGRKALFLLPAVALILFIDVQTTRQFAAFGRDIQPAMALLPKIRPGSHILPFAYHEGSHVVKHGYAIKHLHSYFAALTRSYDPDLFDQAHFPVRYRAAANLPRAPGDQLPLKPSELEEYDYIFVQGIPADPVREGRFQGMNNSFDIERIAESGHWRLYEVKPEHGRRQCTHGR